MFKGFETGKAYSMRDLCGIIEDLKRRNDELTHLLRATETREWEKARQIGYKAGFIAGQVDIQRQINRIFAEAVAENEEENYRDSRHTEWSCRETVESDRSEPTDSEESAGTGWYLHGYSYRNPIRPELKDVFVEVATADDRRLFWPAKHIPWSLVYRWRFVDETDQSMHQDEESDAKARLVPRKF